MTDEKQANPNPEPGAIDLWDRMETRSLINLLPPGMQTQLLEAGRVKPDFFGLDERTLWKQLRASQAEPSQTDNQLRFKFWFEYEAALQEHRKMEPVRVYAGICSKQYFYERVLSCAPKVAWIVTPPLNYDVKLDEALAYGMERMRDILEIDPTTYPAGARIKLMELQAKVTAMLDMRKKGAYTQRVENKNMNLNVSTTDKQVAAVLAGSTMEQLDTRIKELEKRERRALNLPEKSGAKEDTKEDIADADYTETS